MLKGQFGCPFKFCIFFVKHKFSFGSGKRRLTLDISVELLYNIDKYDKRERFKEVK